MNAKKTFLVVDDSRVSRLLIRQCILTKFSEAQIDEAGTGEDAVSKAGATVYDAIFMDVNMPGMGGLAASEILRQSNAGMPIALITANVQNATRQRAAELALSFIEKPISEDKIHAFLDVVKA